MAVNDQLVKMIKAYMPIEGVLETDIPGFNLMRMNHPNQRQAVVYEPSIYVVVQGRKKGYLNDTEYTYDGLNYLVLTVPLPIEAHVICASEDEPYLAMRLAINLVDLKGLLSDMTEKSESPNSDIQSGIFVSPMDDALVEGFLRLIKCLDDGNEMAVLAPMIKKELLYRVICGERGDTLKAFAHEQRSDHQIAKVIQYIQKQYDQTLDVKELASVANMSASSFYNHFKSVTGLPPLQYIKSMRLHHAKRMIEQDQIAIGEVAFQVGYSSPSQFSREYKRQFGISPSEGMGI